MKIGKAAQIYAKIAEDPDSDHRSILKDAFEAWLECTTYTERDELTDSRLMEFQSFMKDFIADELRSPLIGRSD